MKHIRPTFIRIAGKAHKKERPPDSSAVWGLFGLCGVQRKRWD